MRKTVAQLIHEYGVPVPMEEIRAANTRTPAELAQDEAEMAADARASAAESRRRQEEADAARMRAQLERCHVPAAFISAPIDHRRDNDLDAGRGVYVFGPRGTGKTTLAASLLKAWVERHGATALFATVSGMLTDINGSHHDGRGEQEATHRYEAARLLVLDDVDKRVATPGAVSKLFEIADARWAERRPTIWTSQISLGELRDRLADAGGTDVADALASRISGSCALAQTSGHDLRMQARA